MSNLQQMIESYAQGPGQLRQAIAGMSKEQIIARPVANRWSTLEVIVHIADFEPILADRMKRIISHDRPLLFTADENFFATHLFYADRDLDEELNLIEYTRKQMVRILNKLPNEAGIRTGVHSQKGLVSLESVLNSAINHIPHHIKFIMEKRKALGLS